MIVNFMNILMLYSLSNWLPTLVTGMGYDQQTAVLVSTLLQVGGAIGTFGLAWVIARRGFMPVLLTTFAVAAVSTALIGQPGFSLALLSIVVFVAGCASSAGSRGSTLFRPATIRPTCERRVLGPASASAVSARSSGQASPAC